MYRKLLFSWVFSCIGCAALAQQIEPDQVYQTNIQQVKLFPVGNPLGYPVIRLGSADQLELHFDDREGG
ncbi:MAG: DUF5103 domain-containing protein, partial [Flavihumibacter sp.]|nr:DUF5103 domain-containing protein [Flavihumibacter sp.]